MPIHPPAPKSALPDNLNPAKVAPGVLVQRLINAGKLPHSTVPYPRFDDLGKPACHVHLRLLTTSELDECLVKAKVHAQSLARKVGAGEDLKSEELEYNARITEILALACRDPEDPGRPFFEHGASEARLYCTAEELGSLANEYAKLATERPGLSDLSEDEMDTFLRAVAEGAQQFPFSYCSRGQLETLLIFASRRLAEQDQ